MSKTTIVVKVLSHSKVTVQCQKQVDTPTTDVLGDGTPRRVDLKQPTVITAIFVESPHDVPLVIPPGVDGLDSAP